MPNPSPPTPPRVVHLSRLRTAAQDRLEAVVRLVDVAERVLRRAERTLGDHGVTLPQFDVLSNLLMRDGLTQQELATRLQVTKGNVCGLLDRLEKAGWVVRRPDKKDGRTNRLSITPAGRGTVERLRPLHDAAVLDLVTAWAESDVAVLQDVLSKLDAKNET